MKSVFLFRIFRPNEYRALKIQKKRFNEVFYILSKNLYEAKTLEQLMEIHKFAWNVGFQSQELGPDMYGMFRTEDIHTMSPSEVFIGGKFGLNTHNIPYWTAHKSEEYSEKYSVYDVVMMIYRDFLWWNFRHFLTRFNKETEFIKIY